MGDIVNLKLVKKRMARAAREAGAEANRANFGQTKAEKNLTKAKEELANRRLEAHKLEDDEA